VKDIAEVTVFSAGPGRWVTGQVWPSPTTAACIGATLHPRMEHRMERSPDERIPGPVVASPP
jgi:hypothetical protein